MVEIIETRDKEHWLALRSVDVTSTEVSALFGANQYLTKYELWHRKKAGKVVKIEENNFMKWGTRLQDSIAAGIAGGENLAGSMYGAGTTAGVTATVDPTACGNMRFINGVYTGCS